MKRPSKKWIMIGGGALVVLGVALVVSAERPRQPKPEPEPEPTAVPDRVSS